MELFSSTWAQAIEEQIDASSKEQLTSKKKMAFVSSQQLDKVHGDEPGKRY